MRKFVWNIVMRINLHLKINILKIIKNTVFYFHCQNKSLKPQVNVQIRIYCISLAEYLIK